MAEKSKTAKARYVTLTEDIFSAAQPPPNSFPPSPSPHAETSLSRLQSEFLVCRGMDFAPLTGVEMQHPGATCSQPLTLGAPLDVVSSSGRKHDEQVRLELSEDAIRVQSETCQQMFTNESFTGTTITYAYTYSTVFVPQNLQFLV